MLRALETVERGAFEPDQVIDRVTLDLEARRKRRQALTAADGTGFLVDLPAVPSLGDGDGFRLESGEIIAVDAALEALIEVRAGIEACAGPDLPRIAWHLGNRHLPVQFVGDVIRLRADHVIEAMLKGMGADIRHVEAPFDPEGGAYHQAHGPSSHGHTHSHD